MIGMGWGWVVWRTADTAEVGSHARTDDKPEQKKKRHLSTTPAAASTQGPVPGHHSEQAGAREGIQQHPCKSGGPAAVLAAWCFLCALLCWWVVLGSRAGGWACLPAHPPIHTPPPKQQRAGPRPLYSVLPERRGRAEGYPAATRTRASWQQRERHLSHDVMWCQHNA